jgi:hypothetical protein
MQSNQIDSFKEDEVLEHDLLMTECTLRAAT